MDTKSTTVEERALIKAAKLICDLKSGLCPMHEPDFIGCPHACTEDVRPWRCWVIYLTILSQCQNKTKTIPPLKQAA